MKSKLLFSILILLGCNDSNKKNDLPNLLYKDIVKIDSCEYIILSSGYTANVGSITHKGNCKYCIQRQKGDTIK